MWKKIASSFRWKETDWESIKEDKIDFKHTVRLNYSFQIPNSFGTKEVQRHTHYSKKNSSEDPARSITGSANWKSSQWLISISFRLSSFSLNFLRDRLRILITAGDLEHVPTNFIKLFISRSQSTSCRSGAVNADDTPECTSSTTKNCHDMSRIYEIDTAVFTPSIKISSS